MNVTVDHPESNEAISLLAGEASISCKAFHLCRWTHGRGRSTSSTPLSQQIVPQLYFVAVMPQIYLQTFLWLWKMTESKKVMGIQHHQYRWKTLTH